MVPYCTVCCVQWGHFPMGMLNYLNKRKQLLKFENLELSTEMGFQKNWFDIIHG